MMPSGLRRRCSSEQRNRCLAGSFDVLSARLVSQGPSERVFAAKTAPDAATVPPNHQEIRAADVTSLEPHPNHLAVVPGGLITLLFTDIEGSTRMLDRLGDRYEDLLGEHDRIIRGAIAATGGRVVRTAGDSFFAVFSRAGDAAHCARRAQLALGGGKWPAGQAPRVRVGIHTGTPTERDGDFVGIDVHRAARVMAVAFGGQVLVSEDTVKALEPPVDVLDLGFHRLKDLPAPEHLFQLLAPGLEREFPRLRSLNRSNLPTPATELVGREAEVAGGLGLLARPDVRLLTLVGAGGVGKTRLAVEIGADAVGRYRDGVWMLALASIPERALMVSELARLLEVNPAEGQSLEQTLSATLSDRELLLVLDNFEHLLPAAAMVADLLAAAPNVDVLATSREPLRVRGEQRLEVPPLAASEAADLFEARARAVRPDLLVEGVDREAIERICARLDGLPLAVELAAGRAAIFAPRVLETRLAERLALPAGARDLPERQRTLRAAIDWSYQLLEPAEQAAFRSLAPFVGGVRLDSAELIWGAEAVERLISLAAKSLLRRREDSDSEPRLWMLETIREFALERAAVEGATEEAAAGHADHFLAFTVEAEPELIGKQQREWLDRLEDDHLNLRAALDHLTERDPAKAVIMAGNLTWFWTIRGYATEAWRRLNDVLAVAPADAPGRGLAVYGASDIAVQLNDDLDVRELLLQAVALAKAEGNQRLASVALSHLAVQTGRLGDQEAMKALHEEAIATARTARDGWALAITLNNYAIAESLRADSRRSLSMLGQALDAVRPTGDLFMIAIIANNIAEESLNLGDLKRAETLSAEALELAREIKFRSMVTGALVVQALTSLERGDIEHARAQLAEAIRTSSPWGLESAALLLATAGTIAAIARQPVSAAKLWGAAEHARQRVGLDETPAIARLRNRWQPAAAATLDGQPAWDDAWKTGGELTIDDALGQAAIAITLNGAS